MPGEADIVEEVPPTRAVETIDPSLEQWQFFAMEERLRAARNDVPNLRLANTLRRYLAGVVLDLASRDGREGLHPLTELTKEDLLHLSISNIGALAVRSASAAITLVASGYDPESLVYVRRLVECNLRARAILDDHSGEHARQWLQGRARPSAERLAQKYGSTEDIAFLSIGAHADARGMALLHAKGLSGDGVATVPLFPHRESDKARSALFAVAYECGFVASCLAQAFGVSVKLSGWASQALQSGRDAELAAIQQQAGAS